MKKQKHPTKRDRGQASLWSYKRKKPALTIPCGLGAKKRRPRRKHLLKTVYRRQ